MARRGKKNEEENPFGFSRPEGDQYSIDLGNIPQESAEYAPEEPDWDINATTGGERPKPKSVSVDQNPPSEERFEERVEPRADRDRMERGSDERERRGPRRFESEEERPFDRRRDGGRFQEDEDDSDDSDDVDDDENSSNGPRALSGKLAFLNKVPFFFASIPRRFAGMSKKGKLFTAGGLAVALIVLIAAVAVSTQEASTAPVAEPTATKTAKPKPTAEAKPTKAPKPERTWDVLLQVGIKEKGITTDGLEVSIDRTACNVPAVDARGESVPADDGFVWCEASFSARNVSDQIITVSANRFVLTPRVGELSYLGDKTISDVGGGNAVAKLISDESVSGKVFFMVEEGVEISKISVSTFGGGNPVVVSVAAKQKDRDEDEDSSPTPTPSPSPTKR